MKTLLASLALIISLATITPASAANWTQPVQNAINSGDYDAINQIVAANPSAAGQIAMFIIGKSQENLGEPDRAVKLLNVAVPLAAQIQSNQTEGAIKNLKSLLQLAGNQEFQSGHPKDAAQIYTAELSILSLPNFANKDPKFQGIVVTEADDFLKKNPGADEKLKDDVSLAMGNDLNGVNPDIMTIRRRERHEPSPE
jgi:opacity protein-like surface antigen